MITLAAVLSAPTPPTRPFTYPCACGPDCGLATCTPIVLNFSLPPGDSLTCEHCLADMTGMAPKPYSQLTEREYLRMREDASA